MFSASGYILQKTACENKEFFVMYHLQQVHDFNNCEQIQALFSVLPKKPYCTNAKGVCYPRTKSHALKHAYIQPNTPFVVHCLVFDLDYPQALLAYHDNNAPRPHTIVVNPENGHAHYTYLLAEPIGLTGKSSQKAIDYLYAVYFALRERLGADWGYSANLTKNPAHNAWQSFTAGRIDPYTLDELAESLNLPTKAELRQARKQANDAYYGRNCAVFDAVRHQAYPIAHKHTYQTLYNAVLAIATTENAKFNDPMHPNEVRHIAKSIAKFCKSPRFGDDSKFIEKQRRQGRNGGLKSDSSNGGKARSAKYDDKRQKALYLCKQGISNTEIARTLGVSRVSVINWLK